MGNAGIAVLAFFAVFILAGSGGVILFYREQMAQRLSAVIAPDQKDAVLVDNTQHSGFSLASVAAHLERVIPKSQAEVGATQQKLIRAGFRGELAPRYLNSAQIAVPVLLAAIVFFTGLGAKSFFLYIVVVLVGYLLPDMWLRRQIKVRQKAIRKGLPDILDLLVICIEAGLSLDQATKRTTEELTKAHPALCDEMNIVVLEQRAGRPRSECWKHLAERTDVDVVRNLVSVLIQSEQFGTSIAKTLRVHSDTLRTQRIQQVEEMAAKTTVKLVFPLVLFIFPSLFLVVLGPALITIVDSFKAFLNN
jgi:tight adherence protein C